MFKKISRETVVKYVLLGAILLALLVFFLINQNTISTRFDNNFIRSGNYQNLIKGLGITFLITIFGFGIGFILGAIVCIVQGIQTKNIFLISLRQILNWYVALFRGTPIVVQLLIIYYIIFTSFSGNPLWVAILAFGLNSGAYISEIIRGGINAVSKGQMEAGRALGLPYKTVMLRVIIPQALRNSLPSLFNEFVTLFKETSIVGFIGAVDLTLAFRRIANATYDYEIVYIIMGFAYFIIIVIITKLLTILEKRVNRYDRT